MVNHEVGQIRGIVPRARPSLARAVRLQRAVLSRSSRIDRRIPQPPGRPLQLGVRSLPADAQDELDTW